MDSGHGKVIKFYVTTWLVSPWVIHPDLCHLGTLTTGKPKAGVPSAHQQVGTDLSNPTPHNPDCHTQISRISSEPCRTWGF
jgi:hypothetical protein